MSGSSNPKADSEPQPQPQPKRNLYPYLTAPPFPVVATEIPLRLLEPVESVPDGWEAAWAKETPPWPPTLYYGHKWTKKLEKLFRGVRTQPWRMWAVGEGGEEGVEILWTSLKGPREIAQSAPDAIQRLLPGSGSGMKYFYSSQPLAQHWRFMRPTRMPEVEHDEIDDLSFEERFALATEEEAEADGKEIDPLVIAQEARLHAEAKARQQDNEQA